jgi:hypothetical protein
MKTLNGLLLGRGTAHRAAYRLNANVTIDRWPVDLADLFSVNRPGPGPRRAYEIRLRAIKRSVNSADISCAIANSPCLPSGKSTAFAGRETTARSRRLTACCQRNRSTTDVAQGRPARRQSFVNRAALRFGAWTRHKPSRYWHYANRSTIPTATIGTSSWLRIAR